MARTIQNFGLIATALLAGVVAAHAQFSSQPGPGTGGGREQTCQRLEAQLAAIDRGGGGDAGRAEQVRRYEDAANRQQLELDRMVAQSRRTGCEGSGFFLFGGGQPAQCGPLNNQVQQMRANLDKILYDLQRLQSPGANYERDGQRRALMASLSQYDCGPQYRSAQTQSRGLFDTLFGDKGMFENSGNTYRTVCVKTCDGSFFPLSFATNQSKFRDDERTCQRTCPATEVQLFTYRNPGEDIGQATSLGGRPYTELPNAFKFRQEFNSACSCKRPGETWAEALKNLDDRSTVERGDIIVTDERAKALSQPQGRPGVRPGTAQKPAEAAPAPEAAAPDTDQPKKPIRSVGPQFIPVR